MIPYLESVQVCILEQVCADESTQRKDQNPESKENSVNFYLHNLKLGDSLVEVNCKVTVIRVGSSVARKVDHKVAKFLKLF